MQKLFSAFPGGWPGVGLLLLRGFVSFTLMAQTTHYLANAKMTPLGWMIIAVSLASAACLLIGLLTPVVAIAVTLGDAAALALSVPVRSSIEVVVLAVAIALLGPGAFSVDARMFGRREIVLPNTPRSPKSWFRINAHGT